MFCKNCGKQLNDGEVCSCTSASSQPLQTPVQPSYAQPAQTPPVQPAYTQQPPVQQPYAQPVQNPVQPAYTQQPPVQQPYAQPVQNPVQPAYTQQPPVQQPYAQPVQNPVQPAYTQQPPVQQSPVQQPYAQPANNQQTYYQPNGIPNGAPQNVNSAVRLEDFINSTPPTQPQPQKNNKKLFIGIGIAVAVVVIFAIIIAAVGGSDSNNGGSDNYSGSSETYILESNGSGYSDGSMIGDTYYNSWAGFSMTCPSGFEIASAADCESYSGGNIKCVADFTAYDDDAITFYFVDMSDEYYTADAEYLKDYLDSYVENMNDNLRDEIDDFSTEFTANCFDYEVAGETYMRNDVTVSYSSGSWCYSVVAAYRDDYIVMMMVVGDTTSEIEDLLDMIEKY